MAFILTPWRSYCFTCQVSDERDHYLYWGPGKKPTLLKQLEGYIKKELNTLGSAEPQRQELKLQVYCNAFARLIEEFTIYQPLLLRLQDRIKELKQLESRMRLVTEECDRKVQRRWDDGQAQVRALQEANRQLQKDMDEAREREETQNVVRDLATQYQQYREEQNSCRLLLFKLSLCSCLPAEEDKDQHAYEEDKDPVMLRLALKACRADLTKAHAELAGIRAERGQVVPRWDWDALEQKHECTLLQLKSLQEDLDQLKSEHDAPLEVDQRDATQAKSQQEGDGEDGSQALKGAREPSLDERPLDIDQLREQLDGKGLVSVADLHAALKSLRPALESAAIDQTLSLAFQVDKEELDQNRPQLDTEVLLQRLAVSPMTGPPPP
ncbi:hypothetical protein NHX12_025647 [Muraenolepis orangiensis]|uniref:Translin-associated factor X-interacting protein 1 N-terminal domain-containing protein n=1 Tax=Muraenolepis orangiensis TaxID=630683 RepID=A0A9Q0EG28_9TELE|nr:hypothetical protein NHX12_025647 [Muraenolepis orangiensis]